MWRKALILACVGWLSLVHSPSQAQTQDSLDLEFLLGDTTSIFDLIDSLLLLDTRYSALVPRIGYTSQVQTAGRTFEVYQYGLTPGISYYHKSGLFLDYTGYWNSDTQPHYNLSVFSAGYLNNIKSKLFYAFSYDHLMFSEYTSDSVVIDNPFSHSLSSNVYVNINHFMGGVDYMYLFGESSAHRISPFIGANYGWNNVGFLDRISILPTLSMTFGNADILKVRFREVRFYSRRLDRQVRRRVPVYKNENVFGLMNYQAAVPVTLSWNNLALMIQYAHNFPVSLPGETLELDAYGYVSCLLMYSIRL